MTTRITSSVLASTAVTAGSYGGSNQISVFTVDAQGRLTFAANATPSIANTQITGLITSGQIASIANTQITGLITSGQIASITSSQVTTALGFTPYNATNPSGYTTNVGTVTSVGGTGTISGLTLSGTVTTTGSLTLGGTLAVTPSNFASQTAATFLAAPTGAAGIPSFRAIAAGDIPTLNQNTTGTAAGLSATLAVSSGGTGAATLTANSVIVGNGTSAVSGIAPGTSGNVLMSDGTNWTSSALGGLGMNQTWQDVTASRALSTTYTNSTGKPIVVIIKCSASVSASTPVSCSFTLSGITYFPMSFTSGTTTTFNTYIGAIFSASTVSQSWGLPMIIPPSATYSFASSAGGLTTWLELR